MTTGSEAAHLLRHFPRAELRRVTTPAGDTGIYRINLRQSSEINQRHPYTTVWVDRWSGQIKEVRNPAKFSKGETFASWIWSLHTGEALGAKGRFAWFLAGISLFVLYVSGLLCWLCRSGKVRDREVNFAAMRPFLYRMRELGYRAGLGLFHLMWVLIQRAKKIAPHITKGSAMLCQWIKLILLMITNRQKRIGQK